MFLSLDGVDGTGKPRRSDCCAIGCALRSRRGHLPRPGQHAAGRNQFVVCCSTNMSVCRSSRRSEMLLYMAARAQLVEEVLRPALASGKTVVSDRYLLANVVYQGHAGGLAPETMAGWSRRHRRLPAGSDHCARYASRRSGGRAFDRPKDRMEKQGAAFERARAPDFWRKRRGA